MHGTFDLKQRPPAPMKTDFHSTWTGDANPRSKSYYKIISFLLIKWFSAIFRNYESLRTCIHASTMFSIYTCA